MKKNNFLGLALLGLTGYIVMNLISFGFLAASLTILFGLDKEGEDDQSQELSEDSRRLARNFSIFSAVTQLFSFLLIYLIRKIVVDLFIFALQIGKEYELSSKIEDNKVKVSYPLFLKKGKNNIFSRAKKGDFSREKKPAKSINRGKKLVLRTVSKISKFHSPQIKDKNKKLENEDFRLDIEDIPALPRTISNNTNYDPGKLLLKG